MTKNIVQIPTDLTKIESMKNELIEAIIEKANLNKDDVKSFKDFFYNIFKKLPDDTEMVFASYDNATEIATELLKLDEFKDCIYFIIEPCVSRAGKFYRLVPITEEYNQEERKFLIFKQNEVFGMIQNINKCSNEEIEQLYNNHLEQKI